MVLPPLHGPIHQRNKQDDQRLMEETPSNPPPAGPTVVVGLQSCASYVLDLTVKKKVINVTEGNFSITDVNGNVVFKVKGSLLSIRDHHDLVDVDGSPILSMQQKLNTVSLQMDSHIRNFFTESFCGGDSYAHQDIERCPFLRNINEPTNFSFSSFNISVPVQGTKGPIFEDGPDFEMAFRLFHGRDGVVPLSGTSFMQKECSDVPQGVSQFNPLAARAATISLSSFGSGGLFGFDFFSKKFNKSKQIKKPSKQSSQGGNSSHESLSNEWLQTGQCPIAKSYRAVSAVVPLVAKVLQPPPGINLRCPPAIIAARAALARTTLVKNLRPQPLHSKMLAIAMLGMAANVPLGVWREHTQKFSPQWFVAIHAAVPFIAMLRKSVLMPKTAMAFTIAASILGQTIGSRAERMRLKAVMAERSASAIVCNIGHCNDEKAWDPISSEDVTAPKASVCY